MLPTDSGPRAASSSAERQLAELSPRDQLHARRAMADGYLDIGSEPDDPSALREFWVAWCEAEQIPTTHMAEIDGDRMLVHMAFPVSLGRELSTTGLRAMRKLFRQHASPIAPAEAELMDSYVDGREARLLIHREDVAEVLERVQAVINDASNSIPDPRVERPKGEDPSAATATLCDRCDAELMMFRSTAVLGISPGLPALIDKVLCLRCSIVVQDALRVTPEAAENDRRRATEAEQRGELR